MLSTKLTITLGIALLFYFIIILLFLKHRAIELKYTLLWIFSGVVMAIMIFFPIPSGRLYTSWASPAP